MKIFKINGFILEIGLAVEQKKENKKFFSYGTSLQPNKNNCSPFLHCVEIQKNDATERFTVEDKHGKFKPFSKKNGTWKFLNPNPIKITIPDPTGTKNIILCTEIIKDRDEISFIHVEKTHENIAREEKKIENQDSKDISGDQAGINNQKGKRTCVKKNQRAEEKEKTIVFQKKKTSSNGNGKNNYNDHHGNTKYPGLRKEVNAFLQHLPSPI